MVTVTGYWQSEPSTASSHWAEVLVINSSRTPQENADETPDSPDVIRLFRNSVTQAGMEPFLTNPLMRIRFPLSPRRIPPTLILKAGNEGGGTSEMQFDNIEVRSIPAPTTVDSLPEGFESRTLTFPRAGMDRIMEHPVTHDIYAIRDGGNKDLYKIDVSESSLRAELVAEVNELGIEFGQLVIRSGRSIRKETSMSISHDGDLLLGTYQAETDSYDWSSFLDINDTYDIEDVGDHGFGGLAIDPHTETLYINYGAIQHGDGNSEPEPDNGLNTRILRVNPGWQVTLGCSAVAHATYFGITVRSDGSPVWSGKFNRLSFR
ncbi:MAG: hypothetical protein ACOX5R_23030 [bacterium]